MRIVGNDPTLSRQITATASGAISAAGKPLIVNTDGTVQLAGIETLSTTVGSAATIPVTGGGTTWTNIAYDSNSNRIVIVYQDGGNSDVGTAVVGEVNASNNTISFGTPVVFENAETYYISIDFDSSANKFLIAYRDSGNSSYGTAIVGTVDNSDNSISFGTAAVFESAQSDYINTSFDPDNSKFLIVYKDVGNSNYGTGIVATISGTSVSFGSPTVYYSGSSDFNTCIYDTNANKFLVAYRNSGVGGYGIVGTISSTSVSFGSATAFHTGGTVYVNGASGHYGMTFDSTANKVLIAYTAYVSSQVGYVIVGTISSTSVSFGTAVSYGSAGDDQGNIIAYDSNTNKSLILGYDGSEDPNDTNIREVTVSGTTPTVGNHVSVHSESAATYASIRYDSTAKKIVVAYAATASGSAVGQVNVIQTSGTVETLTTENFIGTSAHSAADGAKVLVNTQGAVDDNQSGLTAGQTYYVDKNGALQLTTNITASAATAAVFESASTKVPDVCFDSTNNRIVIAYQDDDNSDYGTAIVGTVASDGSISFGTPVVFESATTGGSGIAIVHDSNSNKIVIAYEDEGNSQYGTAIVGTVDSADNSISFGSATVFESGEATTIDACFDSNSNKVVIAYSDFGNSQYGKAVVGTVSGTSISFGTIATFESAQTDYISIAFDSTNNKAIIAYADGGDSGKGKAVVGTVSGTDISFGTVVTFENADTRYTSLAHDSSNEKTVIAYHDAGNSDYVTAIVGTVSGTDISFGTAVVAHSTSNYGTSTTFNSDANKIVITYYDYTGTDLRIIDGTVSGTSISFASNVELLDGGGYSAISSVAGANHAVRNVFDSNVNKTVSVYRNLRNSNYGTAIVYTSGNDLSGSLSTDAVTAGTALSATKLLVKG